MSGTWQPICPRCTARHPRFRSCGNRCHGTRHGVRCILEPGHRGPHWGQEPAGRYTEWAA